MTQEIPLKVSVIIPAYNIENYIARAIECVLAQTYPASEIIVVDDGSTDNTANIVKQFPETVQYIYQDNQGAGIARNRGIEAAQHDWIAFLDGDDEWLNNFLELHVDLLKRNPHLKWSSSNLYSYRKEDDRKSIKCSTKLLKKLLNGKDYFDDFYDAYRFDAMGNSNSMMIHHSCFKKVGLFGKIPSGEDADMWNRIALSYPQIGFICEPISVYHLQRPGSTMNEIDYKKQFDATADNVARVIELAKNTDRFGPVERCMKNRIQRLIRGYLFRHEHAIYVKDLNRRFKTILPPGYRLLINLLATFPRSTELILMTISKTLRILPMYHTVKRPPRK